MRVLVTWISPRGGTAGIGRIVGETLVSRGYEVVTADARRVRSVDGFDAVILGGALYANRWPADLRRFVNRHVARLRKVPVWFFSSGPLDDSADRATLAAPTQVSVLAERVGARGHVTFGGRLEASAKGFPASAMAKSSSGDWRNPDRVRAWAGELAAELPGAVPGKALDHPGRSVVRLLAHGVVGWAVCAAVMFALLAGVGPTAALVLHAIVGLLIFAALAWNYFAARGAREPLTTAVVWTSVVALLDLVIIAGALQRSLAMFTSFAATWLPLALIFLVTWATGAVMSTLPWPKPPAKDSPGGLAGPRRSAA